MASEVKRGATLLSIESQVRSVVAMILAPALGLFIDGVTRSGEVLASWPVAAWGIAVGVLALVATFSRRTPSAPIKARSE